MASIVVFLVALPLCMGIAIASGVPPALGLITGIVGGAVVGFFAGQPLQVSGPAAGLAVLVWQLIDKHGIAALGLAVLITGAIQLLAGVAGLGRWFRAVSPAVVLGMLAGIGVLILASQFHVMLDATPRSNGLANLLAIPAAIVAAIDSSVHHVAAALGVLTIVSIVLWEKLKPASLRMLPGALVGVALATVIAQLWRLPIARVEVPAKLTSSFNFIGSGATALLSSPGFWAAAIGMALIASAETLLSATAVDRIHDGPRTDYNKELRAQGIGNMLCGIVGALPMTGVIVRSSANVEAGGKTRWSTILHGLWIVVLVAALPQVLSKIPTSSLAAILVYTGWKLIGINAARRLAAFGRVKLGIWAATVIGIVCTDLLIGVAIGLGLAMLRLVLTFARLDVRIETEGGRTHLHLVGAATFMSLPKLAEALESIPPNAMVHVHLDRVAYVDHACLELLEEWDERHPGEVFLEMERLRERSKPAYAAR